MNTCETRALVMKRKATDWEKEFLLVEKARKDLALKCYEELMSIVPNDIWSLIVEKVSEKKSNFSIRILTLVSKQLHEVIHQSSPKQPIELSVVNQYPNTKILKIAIDAGTPDIPVMKSLERLIIYQPPYHHPGGTITLWMDCLENEKFPNLSSISFYFSGWFPRGNAYIPKKMREQIRKLSIKSGIINREDMERFPNLTHISCSHLYFKVVERCDLSKLTHLKIGNMSKKPLETFTGKLIYGQKKNVYWIEKGLLMTTTGAIPATEDVLCRLEINQKESELLSSIQIQ